MRTDLFDYVLPPELIAQTPLPRGESRLLVLHRSDGKIEHRRFADLLAYLNSGDTLVINDTRVIARRMRGELPTGRAVEVLLLRPVGDRQWAALVKPGRPLKIGTSVALLGPNDGHNGLDVRASAFIIGITPEGGRLLEFTDGQTRDRIGTWGVSPLPPYIGTPLPAAEEDRYQTVYARHDGSAAAPTAGLHFTSDMLMEAQARGVAIARVTLHVGVDTFRPVKTDDTASHEMHGEWISVSNEAAQIINATQGRIIAVGTTSVRALESAASALPSPRDTEAVHTEANPIQEKDTAASEYHASQSPETLSTALPSSTLTDARVAAFEGETRLFVTPGYAFRAVDALITNFHLPRSTLLMLISALAGRERILHAYDEAVRLRYRFYSFGDAMLII